MMRYPGPDHRLFQAGTPHKLRAATTAVKERHPLEVVSAHPLAPPQEPVVTESDIFYTTLGSPCASLLKT
ncbi:hypothetical protein NDU88_002645 [Pleurodeles waltl]|uniref:Uncharacterized protein n=1 Tax=Pleurodeles waltl TaxID=8319 RepID=A0AAV7T2Y5_PLEWA|nr:hypothetical protein NDU88_002645 [Pleurodeles waltl]